MHTKVFTLLMTPFFKGSKVPDIKCKIFSFRPAFSGTFSNFVRLALKPSKSIKGVTNFVSSKAGVSNLINTVIDDHTNQAFVAFHRLNRR